MTDENSREVPFETSDCNDGDDSNDVQKFVETAENANRNEINDDETEANAAVVAVNAGAKAAAEKAETQTEALDRPTLDDKSETKSATLEEALEKYNIQLPAKKVRLLKEYCELLWTWNERINLTRHDDFDKFVSRDLVDTTRLSQLFQKGEHILDVGSGGGVPGLVLAILRPDVVVELCEATGKKAEALGAIVDELGLDLNVWYAKAEDLLKVHRFHSITIRAVGKIYKLLTMFAPLWNSFDRILMVKGPNWPDERGEARHYNALQNIALRKVDEYENPGAEHGSVILQFCRKSRYEEIEKRAQDRADGKPIDREVEPVEVDNNPRDITERGFGRGGFRGGFRGERGGERRGENRGGSRNEEGGEKRGGYRGGRGGRLARSDDRPRRPFVEAQNRRDDGTESSPNDGAERRSFVRRPDGENSSNGGERGVRVFARKNGKPPKGWTGKTREFRTDSSAENGGEKRFGGEKKFGGGASTTGGSRFSGGKRSGGKFSGNRSQGRPGDRPNRGNRGGK